MTACIVADTGTRAMLQDDGKPWDGGGEAPLSSGFLSFSFEDRPMDPAAWSCPPAGLYVLPAELYLDLRPEQRPFPVFAYGWTGHMAECFREGALDYLRSPWSLEELSARALRLLRIRFRVDGKVFEFSGRSLEGVTSKVELTEAEYRLGRILGLNLNRPVPRRALALALWGTENHGSRAIDVHVSLLRKKLDLVAPGAGGSILSCRGEGYRLLGEYCG